MLESDQGTVTLYQPQPEKYEGTVLSSRGAVSIRTKDGGKEPVFGAIWSESTLEVDRDTRMATLQFVKITDARFPSVSDPRRSGNAEELPERRKCPSMWLPSPSTA